MLNFGFANLGDLVRQKAKANGDKPLVLFGNEIFSYRTFDTLTDRVAAGFAARGMRAGDKAVLMMWNDPWTWIVWLGLAKIGCWVSFVNPHYKGESLDHLIAQIEPEAIVAHGDVARAALDTRAGNAVRLKLVQELPGEAGNVPQGMMRLGDLLEGPARQAPLQCAAMPQDIAGMVHTSGTTGMPKFCLLSHNYYLAHGTIKLRAFGARPDDRFYLSMPLYHAHKHLVLVMLANASVCLSRRFSVSRFWQEVHDSASTILLIHDQPLVMLLQAPPSALDRAHGARIADPGFRMQRQFHERFGVDVLSGVGSNESHFVAWAPWYRPLVDPHYYESDSPGLEVIRDYFDVRVVDAADKEVAAGEIGEIVSRARHPHTQFEGYYKAPAKTADTLRGGWLHSGDLGRFDERGLLHFVGRKAESIRHRGEWVPRELVERLALAQGKVKECALVGIPSPLGDEDLKLYVVPKDSADIDPGELLDHLARQLPRFMLPRYVEKLEALPRTPGLEKLRWRELQSRGAGTAWDREQTGWKGAS